MAYILHIESSSNVCSIAISENDTLLSIKELNSGYTHAENLHLFIEDVVNIASLKLKDLNAISISSGPGSYTGLRIGFSAAKGLAYALNIPLIEISTLKAFANSAMNLTLDKVMYCPLMDARRMEVFTAIYDEHQHEILKPQALILTIDSIQELNKNQSVYFFGDGLSKAKELLQNIPHCKFIDGLMPSARGLIQLAYQKYVNNEFADLAYSEPNYLKEFFFTIAKK